MNNNELLVEQIKLSYIHMYDEFKKTGKIVDYSIETYQIFDEEVVFDLKIMPVMAPKFITININVSKDGCSFNE
jgi:hypothetical protein